MPSVLISGANRGLGLEFARQYAADGWRVFAACRDPSTATDLTALASEAKARVTLHSLDVLDFGTIDTLARELSGETIDLLLNNAGIMENAAAMPFGKIDYARWEQVFRTNTLAPAKMTQSFVPQLERGSRKLVVTLSSGLGSMTDNTDGTRLKPGGLYLYRTSKAAMNMTMRNLSFALKPKGIAAVVISPGHVRTDMGGPNAALGIEESIRSVRKVLDGLTIADTGKFFFYDGREYPW
jgi:NAD(P)-dependent dehydrogenase (short-subunit alcohol dehydrogenase family)